MRTECGSEEDHFKPEDLICPDCRGVKNVRQVGMLYLPVNAFCKKKFSLIY